MFRVMNIARHLFVGCVLLICSTAAAEARCSQATYDSYLDQLTAAFPSRFGSEGPVAKDVAAEIGDKAKWCASTACKAKDSRGYWEARTVYALAGTLWAAGEAANGEFSDARNSVRRVVAIANELQQNLPKPVGREFARRMRGMLAKVDAIAHEGQRRASIH